MIVGFIVAFFTLMQVRESIVGVGAQWFLQLGALTIASATVYSMFRVILYGSLSGVLTHCAVEEYASLLSSQKTKLFEHGMVNKFASSQLLSKTTVRGALYTLRGHNSESPGGRIWSLLKVFRGNSTKQGLIVFWVQPPMILSVMVAMLVVGVMFDWSDSTFGYAFGLLILATLLLMILSLRFTFPPRKGNSTTLSVASVGNSGNPDLVSEQAA
jgi:hypothetical protein